MSKSIIEVNNLSKSYTISHEGTERYTALRDVMARRAKKIFSFPKFMRPGKTITKEEFWALKDISFEIEQGDRVGIIGRNGAGKSTLLKILSRITEPTTGNIKIKGRVASLLEVGTGFHPELTGRENIFLNGAILGMSRVEIKKHFDAIVDFAEIEKFLDTPVKRYSSGMYVRLAFAVAAHLEPEILVVDEVLAVGDAQFQKKCLGKMEEVSNNEGRTVLFVSHNMQAISNLCKKGIYLANGELLVIGNIDKVVETYLHQNDSLMSYQQLVNQIENLRSDPDFKLKKLLLLQDNTEVFEHIGNGKEVNIEIHYELFNRLTGFRVFIDVCDDLGTILFRTFHDEETREVGDMGKGNYVSKIKIPANFLAPITYNFKFLFGIHNIRMLPPTDGLTLRINVEQTGNYNKAYSGQFSAGKLAPSMNWDIKKIN